MRDVVVVVSRCLLAAHLLSSLLQFSAATVVLNSISASFPHLPAKFDGSVTINGICGALYVADPLDGCSPLLHAAASNWTEQRTKFALIIRGECSFEDKLLNAQNSGFQAVIVYDNIDNEDLVRMKVNTQDITVNAVFVSNVAGEILSKYARGQEGECCIYPPTKGSAWTVLAISFFSLLVIITFLLLAFFAPRHWTQWRGRHTRTMRLDPKLVRTLPTFTFTDSGGHHKSVETCAICLEDYRFGENLRLLPCQHAFHLNCIDSWLTKWGTSCPVCKHDIRTEIMSAEAHKRDSPRTDTKGRDEDASISLQLKARRSVTVDVSQAKTLLQSGHQYLDVRTEEEFRRGHCLAPKILNVPYMLNTPQGRVNNQDFVGQVSSLLNPADDILVGCQSGARSLSATSELLAAGFKKVRNVGGGYLAWVDHSFPINKEQQSAN